VSLRTCETVVTETPARSATSLIEIRFVMCAQSFCHRNMQSFCDDGHSCQEISPKRLFIARGSDPLAGRVWQVWQFWPEFGS
jgi:hypothetical protein